MSPRSEEAGLGKGARVGDGRKGPVNVDERAGPRDGVLAIDVDQPVAGREPQGVISAGVGDQDIEVVGILWERGRARDRRRLR